MYTVTEKDFWMPKPSALGWRGLSLLIPALGSSVGFFCFAVLAFSFTEFEALPATFRRGMVLVGAFSLAFGSEFGTLSNVIDIYRKQQQSAWDWAALIISGISTFMSFLLAFATLLNVKATWSTSMQLYGPVILGILAALDSYGGFMEFGLYLNTYDKRFKQWQEAFLEFKRGALHGVNTTEQQPLDTDNTEKLERIRKLLDIYTDNPLETTAQVAKYLGVSRTTVYSYLTELEQQGVIHRNGNGVTLLQEAEL